MLAPPPASATLAVPDPSAADLGRAVLAHVIGLLDGDGWTVLAHVKGELLEPLRDRCSAMADTRVGRLDPDALGVR